MPHPDVTNICPRCNGYGVVVASEGSTGIVKELLDKEFKDRLAAARYTNQSFHRLIKLAVACENLAPWVRGHLDDHKGCEIEPEYQKACDDFFTALEEISNPSGQEK